MPPPPPAEAPAPPTPAADDRPVAERPVRRVRFESMAKFQVEVWINGKRAGFTPLEINLREGTYVLTAAGESLVPVIQVLTVEGENPLVLIPPRVLTMENYPAAAAMVVRGMSDFEGNDHFLIMSLLMVREDADAARLLARADTTMPGDPMVDIIRAKLLLRRNELDPAIDAVNRGLERLGNVSFAWRVRSMALIARGELDEALEAANQAMSLDPFGWRNLRIRARVHEARGDGAAQRSDEERADELYADLHAIMERLPK